jgi:hypothetical protein
MTTSQLRSPLTALAAAVLALTLAACGGGSGEAPPQGGGAAVDTTAPVVTITNNVAAETATGDITFTFSFNRDVGTSFTADDVVVTGGTKGAFTRTSGTSATLVVTPTANSAGTVEVSVAASAVSSDTGTGNAAASARKAFDTTTPPPPPPVGGTVVLANFDDVTPPVAGFEGAEGSAIEAGPAGGGSGNSFKVLRSGGQVFALGIIETTVPVTASRRTITAQVYSPTAGVPMVLKIEGPGGANSGDVQANEAVVVGWQTLTWTMPAPGAGQTFNKIVLLPNLGTVDAPPGKAYYFDSITLQEAAPPPPAGGTVLANFDDVSPPVAGFEGAEGSAVEAGPAGGGSGNSFKVLRSGGQVFALGIIETTVPVSSTRRTISAQVYSPTAGIPMVLKIEGPAGANSGDVAANEAVVVGWQTLTWTMPAPGPGQTFNKIVLLPNLGTVDAPPGKAYYFDNFVLLPAAGGGGGSAGALTFSSGFASGTRTVEAGEVGGFSGSNLDNFGCNGDPANCGGGGEFVPGLAAADSFFFYYYQTTVPATALYMGIYLQAPGVTGGFSNTADTPGVQVTTQTDLKFKLGQNAEWFGGPTNNFMIVMDLGKRYSAGGGTCRLQLRRVVTPTAAAASDYSIPLSSFALVQDCGGAVTSVAAALAASPISQIAFQGTGGASALSDGVRTSGANLSVANGEGRYPTTLVLVGGIKIE